ncbi:MAG TPA: hypothetical protein VGM91_03385 [Conexibacter sp.]|jgi:glucose/arabinose dehydrogenase
MTSSDTSAATASGAAPLAAAARSPVRFARVSVGVTAEMSAAPFDTARTLRVPAGWRASVWARVDGARFEAWTPEGSLLVSIPSTGEIQRLTPRRDGNSASVRPMMAGLTDPQGMAFDTVDGRTVFYVAESNRVDRFDWSNAKPSARTTVVGNLPDTDPVGDDVHRAKSLIVAPDHTLYVTLASSTNSGTADSKMRPQRGSVAHVDPSDGRLTVYATGVRNGEGLSFDPDGRLWTAVNNRDNILFPFHRGYGDGASDDFFKTIPTYVKDHPDEELAKLSDGRNLGWPFCNPDSDVHPGVPGSPLNYDHPPFTPDAHNNPGARVLDCTRLPRIDRGIPAHSAPLGLHFTQGSRLPGALRNGAVVALHGSWNRQPPRPSEVAWFPWIRSRHTLGGQVDLVTGFQLPDGTRWGRPVDTLPGPAGALYVSDDTAGAVYRIGPAR